MSSNSPELKSAQIENPKQNNTPVILSSCTLSSSDPIDSHDFALPAKKTPPDSVESISILKNANTCTKTGNTQVLILQKPASSSPMVIQNKNILPVVSGIDSSSNVTVVQPVIGPSGTTKFVTIPAMGLLPGVSATNPNLPTSLTTVKGNDVKILVPQAGISSNTISNIKQSTGNNSSTQKCSVGHGSGNQVITKVIITSNPSTNQTPGASIPVQSGSGCVTSSVGSAAQPVLIASPTKTLTLSRNLTNVSGTQQIIRTIPGTPPKQGMYVLSPVKPSSKVSVPVTLSKSPRRIAPATKTLLSSVVSGSKMCVVASATTAAAATVSRTGIPIQSPTKVILKPVQQTVLKPTVSNANASLSTSSFTSVMGASSVTAVQQSTSTISGASTQQIQVPGSKFHYVRLVSAPSSSTTTSSVTKSTTLIPVTNDRTLTPTLVPVTSTSSTTVTTSMSSGQVRLTVPIAPALTTQSQMISKQGGQRFIIPSPSLAQIRPNSALPTTQLSQLPTGTLIPMGGTAQGFVMVPAHYVTQLQQPSQSAVQGPRMVIQPVQHQNILPAPASSPNTPSGGSNSSFISLSSIPNNQNLQAPNVQTTLPTTQPQSRHLNGRTPVETTDNRPRKPCNCTKSQCLKLYCDCFANGEFCNNCNCYNCYNNLSHEEERQKAIKACLDRNPLAFHPKIGKSREGDQERRHTKGCNCKRSGCLKNYCECYEAKILCTNLCKCIGCKNFEDSSERKTLMHLADAAEVRVQQQAAAKTKLSSQILDLPTKPPIISTTGERLPFSFVTQEVVEATCLCLLAQAEDGEKSGQHPSVIEKLVFEEFGRCLRQIIDCANRTKVPNTDS